jgi:hypothetical protein
MVVVDESGRKNLSPELASITICLKGSHLLSGVSWATISKCEEDGSETTTTTFVGHRPGFENGRYQLTSLRRLNVSIAQARLAREAIEGVDCLMWTVTHAMI